MHTMESNGLAVTNTQTGELTPFKGQAEAQFEIQSAILVAKNFPRSEDRAYEKLIHSCKRSSFAEKATYNYKRGGTDIIGPSVNLAREAARTWGNIRFGFNITRDEEIQRQIEGWAWDLETNTKVCQTDEFSKLIQRRVYKNNKAAFDDQGKPLTEWIKPDERDLRELTNRRAAILYRNCLLQLIPRDFIDDAMDSCFRTMESKAEVDPDGEKKKIVLAFSSVGVTAVDLEKYLGHSLKQTSPAEIATLRQIYASLRDGNSTWAEYAKDVQVDHEDAKKTTLDDFVGKKKKEATQKKEDETPTPPETSAQDTAGDDAFGDVPFPDAEHEFYSRLCSDEAADHLKKLGVNGFRGVKELKELLKQFVSEKYGKIGFDTLLEASNTPEKINAILGVFAEWRGVNK